MQDLDTCFVGYCLNIIAGITKAYYLSEVTYHFFSLVQSYGRLRQVLYFAFENHAFTFVRYAIIILKVSSTDKSMFCPSFVELKKDSF